MIIADLNLRKPVSYADLGKILREANLIGEEAENVIKMIAAARNILAHAYRRISAEDLQRMKGEILPRAEVIIKDLLRIVEQRSLDPESATGFLETLIQPLKKHGVLLAYLFGSRARGTARVDSDYDIAVLFSSEESSLIGEINLAVELASALNEPVDKVNVVSLNKADLTVKARVLKEGSLIYCSDEEFKRRWERKTLREVLDNSDLYAIYTKRILVFNRK